MSDLISRQAAIDAIEELKNRYFDRKVVLAKAQDAVNNLPTIDPVKHGRRIDRRSIAAWKRIDYKPCGHDYECSSCGWKNDMKTHYCPNCGARMEGEEDERPY